MPYFSIETNVSVDETSTRNLVRKTSAFIAELLGKPEPYVMISIKTGAHLVFGGSDEPAAFVRLKSIGLPQNRTAEFSEKISTFIEQKLEVPRNRTFIDFKDLERNLFGWNGKTF